MKNFTKTFSLLLILLTSIIDISCLYHDEPKSEICISFGVLTYVDDILPIFEARCEFSGCHPDHGNWFDYNTAVFKSATIKEFTSAGIMPLNPKPGGSLTEEEIAKIACWVDNGTVEN